MTRLTAAFFATSLSCVAAYPGVANLDVLLKRTEPAPRDPAFIIHRPNTGLPPSGFNADDQFVDTSDGSAHEWQAPVAGRDVRGECPGLNAAANHGFLNRNGITTIQQAITGLGAAYNMGTDLAAFLAILAVGISGDPLTETWSIGPPFTPSLPVFPARGILGTHNKYEGDASIMRGDAYLNNGSPGIFQLRSFESAYAFAMKYGNNFGFAASAAQSDYVTRWSIENNPYYFSAPFSGLVAPAAHNLVVNLMSNHSAEVPGGSLDVEILKSFFSVTGEPGNFVYTRGHERIPVNWYRRPTLDAHNIPEVLADLFVNNAAFPGILRFGGNTGTVNSFAGVDLQNVTSGAYNLQTLADGNNGACFFLQASLAGLPDAADPVEGLLGSVLNWATSKIAPIQAKLACPQLNKFDNTFFNQFPGANYTGSATE